MALITSDCAPSAGTYSIGMMTMYMDYLPTRWP